MTSEWGDVEHGRRDLDWDVVVGDLTASSYLTPLGQATARRAVAGLSAFFGSGWLTRAANTPRDRIDLASFSPSLFGPSRMQRDAFVSLISLWASLQVLVDCHAEGIGALRRTLRHNPTRIEFRHAMAQARLATQAHLLGARVTLEPAKPDGKPGDLRAVRGDTEVFLEYRAIDPDTQSTMYTRHLEQASITILRIGGEHNVTWSGELPHDPDDEWLRRIREASEHCSRTGTPVEVTTGGAMLRCTPGNASAAGEGGGTVVWPPFDRDQHDRLMRALNQKAAQTKAARAAWIWLEDRGALWPRTPFATSPLADKITTLVDILDMFFVEHHHVLGVILTSGNTEPVTSNEGSARHSRGAGFVRLLPSGRRRESVVIQRQLQVPGQFELISQLCTTEPNWLDAALSRLGASRLEHLMTSPLRSPGGLHLPN